MFKRLSLIAAGAPLAILGATEAAQAIVVSGAGSESITAGTAGMARLEIDYDGGKAFCTGTLLPSGRHMLTAAHCFTDRNGVFDVSGARVNSQYQKYWGGPLYSVNIPVASDGFYIYSGWDGFSGGDIAVLKLASAAPSNMARSDIYRGRDEVGKVFMLAGTGATGSSGATGATENPRQRVGRNQVDAAVESFGPIRGSQLLYDFDSGSRTNDTSCAVFGVCDVGQGAIEGISAFGDSGGPVLVNGHIAGINSYILSAGTPLDIDNQLNSTWGELAGATRVSSYTKFIDDAVAGRVASAKRGASTYRSTTSGNVALISYDYTDAGFVNEAVTSEAESVPEPTSALGLLAVGMGGAGLLSRKRKRSSKSQQSS